MDGSPATSYTNPVVRGCAPDPSAVRVGDDFYLATSSFDLLPGIAIRHSTDLVHWRTIGFAVTRPSQYRRDGRPGPVVLFAPTLRHHDGTFYLVTTNVADRQGNLLVTATDPAGRWSDATWLDADWFDPSLFRDDDGTWYYTRRDLRFDSPRGLGPIVQAVVDVETGALGEFRELTPGDRGFASNDVEGPHLYRVGEWYYLSAAEGSSWKGHMQTIGRARSPWGPFEPAPHNPVLTHRHRTGHLIQTLGHAELVEDAAGRWWALSLGTRHARSAQHHVLGRETFLTPVTWTDDGWPVVGAGGETEIEVRDVQLPRPVGPPRRFDVPDTLWVRGWQTLGAAHPDLDDSAGASGGPIVLPAGADPLVPAPTDPAERARPVGALLLAQTEHDQRFAVVLAPAPDGPGPHDAPPPAAGVAVWTDRRHHCSALVRGRGEDRVVVLARVVDDLASSREVPLPGEGPVRLVVEASATEYTLTAEALTAEALTAG